VHSSGHPRRSLQFSSAGLIVLALLVVGIASCSSRHRPSRQTEVRFDSGWPRGDDFFTEARYGRLQAPVPEVPDAEMVEDDELCQQCHETYAKSWKENVHRENSCEQCHGPASRHLKTRGKEPGLILSFKTMLPAERSEVCLKCHEENACAPGARWRYSAHAHGGVSCTDCHRAHYNVPPGTPATKEPDESALLPAVQRVSYEPAEDPAYGTATVSESSPSDETAWAVPSHNLGAVAPGICYQCHADMQQYQQIAGPHQICGPNGFNCTTCHDAHGKLRDQSRKELCLTCHATGAPTMAWHTSTHDLQGVACTDCHNPHPNTCVPRLVNITHTYVSRPKRLPMSVDEPEACYKCHPKIYGLFALPSHHPLKEGKMVCSDCHDPHGQLEGNLRAERLNLLCWKCHAEKQGPFVYEHPPVTEDCSYCHEPHGTVANDLLRQPTTFLCLRCHSGHRRRHGFANIDDNVDAQAAFYTDCTQCHTQIHGSDLPGPVRKQDFMR